MKLCIENVGPSALAEAVKLMTCIREVTGSSLGRCGFSQFPQADARIMPNIHTFQFIIHTKSSGKT
jgi:hypothetical protein